MFPALMLGSAAAVLVVLTAPLLAELLILTGAALWPAQRRNAAPAAYPLTVVIPAHNEQELIGRCVRSVLASGGADTDVVVVAHNCTDGTAGEAEAAGARVVRLDDPGQRGKGWALSRGFAETPAGSARAVLVVDADSVVSAGLAGVVRGRFARGARAVQCRYEVSNAGESRRTRRMALAFRGFNVVRPRGRAQLGLSAGILGNGFALDRELLVQIPYDARSVVEDLEYHLGLVRAGIRVEFADEATVYGEMPVSDKDAPSQRARWEGGRMLMARRWAPRLLAAVLRGRLRLMEPLLDLLAMPIAMEVVLLAVAAFLPVGWLRLYAAAGFGILIFHVVAAAAAGPDFAGSLGTLVTAPAYIVWKLRILPQIIRSSRANAAWVRTGREPGTGL